MWSAATDLLNDEIVSQQRRAYLRLTQLRAIIDDTALLAVPDAFTRDVIESQLRPAITEALSRHLGRPVQVAVTVRPPENANRDALTAPTAAVAVVPVPKPHVPASREPRQEDSLAERRPQRGATRRATAAGPARARPAPRADRAGVNTCRCTTARSAAARPRERRQPAQPEVHL